MISKIIIVFGSPCSGKSTYVKQHLKEKDIKFDYDLLLRSVSTMKSHEYSDIHLPYIMDFRKTILERSFVDNEIETAYIITTKITNKLIDCIKGKNVNFYEMATSKEECLEYLKNDDTRESKDYWINKIDSWYSWRDAFDLEKLQSEQCRGGENLKKSYFKTQLETRNESDNDFYIEGYFAVFEQETELWDRWFEKISRNAFENSLRNNDIRCLFNHNPDIVLGRIANKTLELRTDTYGLWGRVKINPDDKEAIDIYQRVKRGDINGCSFGFNPLNEEYEERNDGCHWTVLEADTAEVSICTFPAYPQTEIQARQKNMKDFNAKKRERIKTDLKKRLEGLKC